jgi:hypothetical protein
VVSAPVCYLAKDASKLSFMNIHFSEPITLSPEAATEIFRALEKLRIDAGDQLVILTAIEELEKASEAGIRPLSSERRAELKQRSSEIPPKVRARIKEAIQQVYEVFRETQLCALRQTPAYTPQRLAAQIDSESIKMGRRAAQKAGIPYMRARGD